MTRKKGKFIVFEGPDGSGKTTQVRQLASFLKKNGHEVLLTREPGGTRISERIRRLLLDRRRMEMTVHTELLLYMAARAQLVEEVIQPALAKGIMVLADRFVISSVVYQGIAGGLGIDQVLEIGQFATSGIEPDLTFFLDVPAEEGLQRGIRKGQKPDRMESKATAFHRKVQQGFKKLARTKSTYCLMNGLQDPQTIADAIHKEVDRVL